MKYAKKFMLMMGIAMAMCFAGCGDATADDQNKAEVGQSASDADTNTENKGEAEKVENDYFAYTIPEGWSKSAVPINDNTISIMKSNDEAIDVMILPEQPNLDQITMEDYKANVETNLSAQPGCEINKIEVQERAMGEIVYLEMKSLVTKELVQSMIDSGLVTQESVDSVGGVDAYAKGLNLQETAAYYIYDNNILIIDGKCANNGDIEEVTKQVNAIIDTIEIK